MFDAALGRFVDPALVRARAEVARFGLRGGSLRAIAVLSGLIAAALVAAHLYLVGLLLFALSRLVAVLDAELPASTLSFDLIVYAALAFGFAIADPSRALAAAFFMLGAVILAACIGVFGAGPTPSRSAFFMAGIVAFVAIAAICIRPDWFSLVAYAAGLACFPLAGLLAAARIVRSA